MADPLSFTASLLALIQAVRVGGRGLAKLKSCYNAPPEIARLRTEVESLGHLLEDVENFAQSNPDMMARHTCDLLIPAVELATARIGSVNTMLSSPAFRMSKLSDANKARLTLLRYKSRLTNLEREIKESIQEIGVRLSLITA